MATTYFFAPPSTPSALVPSITSFAPASLWVGAVITITGTRFTGATAVRFNGTAAYSFTVNSATQITATVPAGVTGGTLSVVTPEGTAVSSTAFTVFIPTQKAFLFSYDSRGGDLGTGNNVPGLVAGLFAGTPHHFQAFVHPGYALGVNAPAPTNGPPIDSLFMSEIDPVITQLQAQGYRVCGIEEPMINDFAIRVATSVPVATILADAKAINISYNARFHARGCDTITTTPFAAYPGYGQPEQFSQQQVEAMELVRLPYCDWKRANYSTLIGAKVLVDDASDYKVNQPNDVATSRAYVDGAHVAGDYKPYQAAQMAAGINLYLSGGTGVITGRPEPAAVQRYAWTHTLDPAYVPDTVSFSAIHDPYSVWDASKSSVFLIGSYSGLSATTRVYAAGDAFDVLDIYSAGTLVGTRSGIRQ